MIYRAEPLELQADREIEDEWVDACLTVPLTAVRGHDLTEPQRLLLAHALDGTGPLMAREVDGRR